MRILDTKLPCMLSLLLLMSCGGGNTTTKVDVSTGFLISANGFDGGLIIFGKNKTSGERFSFDLVTGTSTQITLKKGSWEIGAVGWDGGSPIALFGGEPRCGKVDANLINDNEAVSLSVTKGDCAQAYFSDNLVDSTPAVPTLKKIGTVVTCNSFVTTMPVPATSVGANRLTSSTSTNYCEFLPSYLQSAVKSVRFLSFRKPNPLIAGAPGFASLCIPMTSNGRGNVSLSAQDPYFGRELRLPLLNVPLVVETFEDSNCNSKMSEFRYKEGLRGGHGEFDSELFNQNATEVRLFLPGNSTRKGTSPLMAIIPDFDCGSSRCKTQPTGITYDYLAYQGQLTSVNVYDQKDCTGYVALGNLDAGSTCSIDGDHLRITFTPTSTGSASFKVGAPQKTYTIGVDLFVADKKARDHIYKRLIEFMGPYSPALPVSFFDGHRNPYKREPFDKVSKMRVFFTPDGISSLFPISNPSNTYQQECMALTGSKFIQSYDFEKGVMHTADVTVSAGTSTKGSFQCGDAALNSPTCASDTYDKKLTILTNEGTSIVEFDCDGPRGKIESVEQRSEAGLIRTWRFAAKWNTFYDVYQRVDFAAWDIDYDGVVNVHEKREMGRARKDGAQLPFNVTLYSFDANKNGSLWNKHIGTEQVQTGNSTSNLCFYQKNEEASTPGRIDDSFYFNSGNFSNIGEALVTTIDANSRAFSVSSWPSSVSTNPGGICSPYWTWPGGDGNKILDVIPPKMEELDSGFFGAFTL